MPCGLVALLLSVFRFDLPQVVARLVNPRCEQGYHIVQRVRAGGFVGGIFWSRSEVQGMKPSGYGEQVPCAVLQNKQLLAKCLTRRGRGSSLA